MTISEIELEMKINGVDAEDIAAVIAACKTKGFSTENIDEELMKRGYDKIFSVNYDDDDEWGDDEFATIEKFPHRQRYTDD